MISFTDLSRDPRAFRQIKYLQSRGHNVVTLGSGSSKLPDVEFLHCEDSPENNLVKLFLRKSSKAFNLLFKKYDEIYWSHPQIKLGLDLLKNRQFDLIIANDIDTLPLALKIAGKNGKVIFDAHEYSPREFEDQWRWRIIKQSYINYLCHKYLPKAAWRYTVCDSIIEEYQKNFGVSFDLYTSAPFFENLKPTSMVESTIRMIYHGIGSAPRSVDEIIKIMDLLDERFTLDVILIPGDKKYIEQIKERAAHNKRIRFLAPVPMLQIAALCNQYDIGFFPLKPLNLNYYFGLGNKFFEFIQARVAIAVSPLPEMQKYVEKYACGFAAKDFSPEAFAEIVQAQTSEKIWQMKLNAHKAADIFSAEENFKKFDDVIKTLFPT